MVGSIFQCECDRSVCDLGILLRKDGHNKCSDFRQICQPCASAYIYGSLIGISWYNCLVFLPVEP